MNFSIISTQMNKWYFDIIVKYLSKNQGKIISNTSIKNKLKSILDEDYQDSKMYKTVYYLKNRWYLLNLRKNLFYIKNPEDTIEEPEVIEQWYRTILKEHVKESLDNKYYIWGLKALEIHLMNYRTPDEIILINQKKQGYETIALDKQALLKNYSNKNKNLFSLFYRYTVSKKINQITFRIAMPEIALLESLYSPTPLQKTYSEELIKQRMKKNRKNLDRTIIEEILKSGKHNSSLNRLIDLSAKIHPNIKEKGEEIIKKYGYLLYE